MKTPLLILVVCTALWLQGCYQPGEISVQNNISQVTISNVQWGDIFVAGELLPGETSNPSRIVRSEVELPSSQKISFRMTANNRTIFLETEEVYMLEQDGTLLIVLSDETRVTNPNE